MHMLWEVRSLSSLTRCEAEHSSCVRGCRVGLGEKGLEFEKMVANFVRICLGFEVAGWEYTEAMLHPSYVRVYLVSGLNTVSCRQTFNLC